MTFPSRPLLPLLVGTFLGCGSAPLRAADWPQFLGPLRNGSTTSRITLPIAKDGPMRLWKQKVGQGFSGPVIAEGKVILFQRIGNEEVVEALAAKTGERIWRRAAPTAYVDDFGFDEGPRGTPCVSGGKVYTFGAEGRLTCLSLADGKKIWELESRAQFHSGKGFFGPACSPLVDNGQVLLQLGGRDGAGVVAFAADTGKLLWQVTDDEAGYASPVMTTLGGERLALCFTRAGLEVIDPVAGKLRFGFPWRSRSSASVNAASPIVDGEEVFLTASYGTGATLLRLQRDSAEPVWSGDESLSAHYATPVKHGHFLYGFHGRQEMGQDFRCLDWRTGKVRWSADRFGAGTVVVAGEQLVLLLESGELVVAAATPDAFHPTARFQVLGSGTRAPFALADGLLVARDKNQLVALEVSGAP